MPDWEKIEFTRRSLKRKETYNEFGKKVRFEPLQSIPKLKRNTESLDQYNQCYETLVWKENELSTEKTNEFVKLAMDKGFSEEQALHIIHFNNFDLKLSECDLDIYKPLIGLQSRPSRDTIRRIVDKIKQTTVNHQNRDLNMILMEFPAHTMGELLDFYANNRISIKKKTVKFKSKANRTYTDKLAYNLTQINPLLCGQRLYEHFTRQRNDPTVDAFVDLSDILDLKQNKLDKYLVRYSKKLKSCDSEDSIDILQALNGNLVESSTESTSEDKGEELDCLLHKLDDIELWMRTIDKQKSTIRHKWDSLDLSLLLLGLHRFGTDFPLLADAIATKTAPMVESFYRMFKDRYHLDKIVKSHSD